LTCEPQSDCRLPSTPELWRGLSRTPALASLDLQWTKVTDLAPLKGRNPMPEVLVDDQALLDALR
jgi:hypothetical protein